MLVKGLTAKLNGGKNILISISYNSEIDEVGERVFLSSTLTFPEFGNVNRSYTTHILRTIPTDLPIDATKAFELLYRAFDSDYIKYVITPHIEDYYKASIDSWIDTLL